MKVTSRIARMTGRQFRQARRGRMAAVAVAAIAAGPASSYAAPGGLFSHASFTAASQMTDSNVGLTTNKFYQNNANINGGAVNINGIEFAAGATTSGTNWTLTGAGTSFATNTGANNLLVGGLRTLVTDFTYGGNPATLTLNGLTPGQTYVFTNYAAAFGPAGGRVMTSINASDGGAIAGYDENAGGAGNGNLLRYTFVAPASSLSFTITPAAAADTFHFYGFSNEQVFTNTYNQTGGGTYNSGANWSNAQVAGLHNVVPNGIGTNASFPSQGASTNVTIDAATTVGHLQFEGTNPYTLSGASTLTLQTGDVAALSALTVAAGTHTISAPVTFASDAVKLGTGTLVFSGAVAPAVAGSSRTLTIGQGALQGDTSTTFQNIVVATNVDNGLVLPASFGGAVTLGGLGGNGNVALADTSAGTVNLTTGNGNNSATFTGVLSGAGTVTKVGTGAQTFAGANTHTGITTINGGVLNVSVLPDAGTGGVPSGLGVTDNTPASVILNGGSLGYSGAANTSTDRQFTIGASGGVASNGAGAVTFASTAPLTFSGPASPRTVLLGGANTGLNTLAALVADTGTGTNITSIEKSGAGRWVLTGTNTYTGVTTFAGGILNVPSLTNYGVPGPLGARTAGQEVSTNVGLRFLGGTLQYTGSTPQSTNRQIRIGIAGATIDASGSVPTATVSFTHSGANADLFDTGGVRTLTLTGTNTGDNSFSIQLANQGASLTHLTKSGAGKWVLPAATAANTYGGVTTFAGGILNVATLSNYGVNSSLGNRAADSGGGNVGLLFRGGTLQYTGSTPQSTDRQIRVGIVGGAFIDASGSNPDATLSFTHTGGNADFFESPGARQLTFTGTNTGMNTFAHTITETGGVTTVNKTGAGTWALTGASTATGVTTVSAGKLLVNGSINSPATVAGGTLGGTGSVAGAVTVNTAGTLAPGVSPGTLTIAAASPTALTFQDGGTLAYEIGATPETSDLVNLTGGSSSVVFGATLNLHLSNFAAADTTGQTYVLIDYVGANPSVLPAIAFTGPLLGTVAIDEANTRIVLTNVAPVPEPTAAGLLGLAAVGLLARRRRAGR